MLLIIIIIIIINHIYIIHIGLADQLERLFLSLALSYKYQTSQITLVVPDNFALSSLHRKNGIFIILILTIYTE